MTELNNHLAFHSPANSCHTCRGEALDVLGSGKDIRIIKHILRVLDEFSIDRAPASSIWDFKSHITLEMYMPGHCPEQIQSIQSLMSAAKDELDFIPYNPHDLDLEFAVQRDSKR